MLGKCVTVDWQKAFASLLLAKRRVEVPCDFTGSAVCAKHDNETSASVVAMAKPNKRLIV
ncbi:MAG TPA: hypothetical protein PK702_04205 [Burkholderiaceae bacterium]|nr:hypothetical protein [Burkholderiaceae bacterium]